MPHGPDERFAYIHPPSSIPASLREMMCGDPSGLWHVMWRCLVLPIPLMPFWIQCRCQGCRLCSRRLLLTCRGIRRQDCALCETAEAGSAVPRQGRTGRATITTTWGPLSSTLTVSPYSWTPGQVHIPDGLSAMSAIPSGICRVTGTTFLQSTALPR